MTISVSTPFPRWAWPLAWEWMASFRARVADDFGPQSCDEFVTVALHSNQRSWGVYRDGELGGLITYQPWNSFSGAVHCTFKRSFWGQATTDTALKLFYEELFGSGVEKTTSIVFRDNHAIRALARRIGARELRDPLRKFTKRGGEFVDGVVIEYLKEDFENANDSISAHHRRGNLGGFRTVRAPADAGHAAGLHDGSAIGPA